MRYLIGIDLGTTNSCVAYIDTKENNSSVRTLKIPQLISEGCVEALATLPSFCYLASEHEWTKGALALPWRSESDYFVGQFALNHGSKVPTHLVQSAKSWLCHSAADRRDKILPLDNADPHVRISPVEATARYLRHIKDAWNASIAKGDIDSEFENQEIILTVPASFDELARRLTVEAAKMAGFSQMTLLEEPQAAFYSWISQHEDNWVPSNSVILVCDVGGGTTDFSLIETHVENGKSTFRRMAVGNHLLLGGDNMDAAIAHYLETKLIDLGHELHSTQHLQLKHEARRAKEILLGAESNSHKDSYRLTIQGSGSNVIRGTISLEVNREEIEHILLKGFFNQVEWEEALKLKKSSGLKTMGLPYENEPSIVKHLAHFLSQSGTQAYGPKKPGFILFNGGAMKPVIFRQSIVNSLRNWFDDDSIAVLPTYSLDLAVARGAAYYAKARRGQGIKISGGLPRSYYLVLAAGDPHEQKKALTILTRGSEEGQSYEPSTTFQLIPNTPVSLQLCSSHVRLHDRSGDLVAIDPQEMHYLPPINTVLRFGKKQAGESHSDKIPVHFKILYTPIGTLEMQLKSQLSDHIWDLEFQIRSVSGQDQDFSNDKQRIDQTFASGYLQEAIDLIDQVFNRKKIQPERLYDLLEGALSIPRQEWSVSILRGLSDVILKAAIHRNLSSEHAKRWWNMVGFLLRPGFGYPLDDFRIKDLWKVILCDSKLALPIEQQTQLWICYRRIAGGLNKGQQMQLANALLPMILSKNGNVIDLKRKGELYLYSERLRAFASMELIETPLKIRVGNAILKRIDSGEAAAAEFWALGRLGARHLLYGSIINVVPKNICEEWVERLLKVKLLDQKCVVSLLINLGRKTDHSEVNLSKKCIDKILDVYGQSEHLKNLEEVLLKENCLSEEEREEIFGETLPLALSLALK